MNECVPPNDDTWRAAERPERCVAVELSAAGLADPQTRQQMQAISAQVGSLGQFRVKGLGFRV